MSDKRLVMILAAENNALNAEIAALKKQLANCYSELP